MSEKTAILPLLETARTFPVTAPTELNGLVLPPKFEGLIASAAISLPMNALSPARSKSKELGASGSEAGRPTTFLELVTLYMAVVQSSGLICWGF